MKKRIFIYLRDKEQLPLICPMVRENTEIEYGIIIECLAKDDFLRTSTGKLQNIQFVEIGNRNIALLSNYGAFISTDTQMAECSNVLTILLNIFSVLNVPIFNLQNTMGPASCEPVSLATHYLNWYDKKQEHSSVIGYPISANEQAVSNGEYILVLTDFQNNHYTGKDISTFFHAIYEYARTHTGASIIWRMSEKELDNADFLRAFKNHRAFYFNEREKICLCNDNPILSRLPISELVAKSKQIITTVTMPRLLDCELYGKPVAVYAKTNGADTTYIKDATMFHNAKELEQNIFDNPCKALHTGLLQPYDNSVFISTINQHYRNGIVGSWQYLESLMMSSNIIKQERLPTHINNNIASNNQIPILEIEQLKRKYKKHITVIRKMALCLGIELLIIIGLLIRILFE